MSRFLWTTCIRILVGRQGNIAKTDIPERKSGMKGGRYLRSGCRILVLVFLLAYFGAGSAWATSIDLNFKTGWSGKEGSNVGTSISDGILTITAKSHLEFNDDPVFVADKAGTIYWGKLGTMNASGGDVYGLGVQNLGLGGSKGISGGGGDKYEALVFSFDNPPGVDAGSVRLGLAGLNNDWDQKVEKGEDWIQLNLEFIPLDNPSDKLIYPFYFGKNSSVIVDFNTLGIPDEIFGSFAVMAKSGHFGVTSLSFTEKPPDPPAVPEPSTMMLLGTGLVGLLMFGRNKLRR